MAAVKPGWEARLAGDEGTGPGTGQYFVIAQHCPDDCDAMSKSFCASRPSFLARLKASQTAIIDTPSIILLQILAACPAPALPACTMVLPIAASIGFDFSKAISLPPTMNVSVAASAPATPPDTGASTIRSSLTWAAAATARADSTAMVEQSISSAPSGAEASPPPDPR